METPPNAIESLVEKAQQYSRISIELYRLKAINKSADIIASLISKLVLLFFFALFFLILNIGIALWVGELMGKIYLGFFTVAGFYAIVGVLFYILRDRWVKTPVKNSIILQALN